MSDKHTGHRKGANQMADTELLPCPFCGSSKITVDLYEYGGYTAYCGECEAEGPRGHSRSEAVWVWNGRDNELGAGTKPLGWLAGTGSDCSEDMYFRREDAQRECDQHNEFSREQSDFDKGDLREPESVYSVDIMRRMIRAERGLHDLAKILGWLGNEGTPFKYIQYMLFERGMESYRGPNKPAEQAGAALASRPAEVDDEGLPPLPKHSDRFNVNGPDGHRIKGYTAEQFRQGQRDAVAADRARREKGGA